MCIRDRNTSALTGESVPRDVEEGDAVISGCININGLLKIRTTKEFGESTVSKILDLVENASSRKSKAEEDVYKRQDASWPEEIDREGKKLLVISEGVIMYLEEEEVKKLLALMADGLDEFEAHFDLLYKGLVAVSYTHLDVYKRQVLPKGTKRKKKEKRLYFPTGTACLLYTSRCV